MATSDPGFDAAGFRRQIKQAMNMGAPPDVDAQVTFHFPNVLVYNSNVDGANVPFDPTSTVTTATPRPPIRVDCAVEYFDSENQPTNFGLLAPSRIVVTVLDVDYEKVKDCAYVVAHGDRYNYRRTEPPVGLFDVGVYTLHFATNSET
jgi:hypothetical protein